MCIAIVELCVDNCDKPYNKTHICHCNTACKHFNNCCDDYDDFCLLRGLFYKWVSNIKKKHF